MKCPQVLGVEVMEASPSGLPMDEATAAPSLSTEAGAEDGYFSLLDMFVWTRWVDTCYY